MIWSRPTCEINGMTSGYAGEGFKTVLPSYAAAKVSFRLVGEQDPFKIREDFRAMVRAMVPADCQVEFWNTERDLHRICPSMPRIRSSASGINRRMGYPRAFIGCGGSIPIAGYFQEITGRDPLLIGFGKDDDQLHSPNEKYDMESFHKGIRSWARILDKLAG